MGAPTNPDTATEAVTATAAPTENRPRLSVIMPCHNVADTLRRAVDSILTQVVDFTYEIILIDDASTDDTLAVMRDYAEVHSHIKVLRNEANLRNARTFSRGLRAAKGDYFCVLDGDDYYTNRQKLQRQVDFLDSDVAGNYVGTAHYFVVDTGDGMVNFAPQRRVDDFTYADFLNGTHGYYHTSTYMYRNIFRTSPLDLFDREEFRGDTPRTLFHLKYSNKKIKVLGFVGSAYSFTGTGIWTSLTEKAQVEYQINLYRNFGTVLDSAFEQKWVERQIRRYEDALRSSTLTRREYPTRTLNQCLAQAAKSALLYTTEERDYMFRGAYYSDYLDTAVATIGEVFRVHNPDAALLDADPDAVCIVASYLSPRGGGIFREIRELIELYGDKRVTVIVSRHTEPDAEAIEILEALGKVKVLYPNDGTGDTIEKLHRAFVEVAPSKAYFFIHHFDTYGPTLIQSGPCKNIVAFSYDHGFLCGISNPNIDIIVAKRPIDYHMLKERFGDRVAYIPTANRPALLEGDRVYTPFSGHTELITASGAARFYKLGGPGRDSYVDLVVELLKRTGGRHFHIGPVPDEAEEQISARLAEAGLREDQFVRLGWVDNVAAAMLDNAVDVFIEPFPTVSYKLTLDLYSAGIPVISRTGQGRMGTVDFTYPGNLTWGSPEGFLGSHASIDAATLGKHSELSVEYFEQFHSYERLHEALRAERSLDAPLRVEALDAVLHDVYDFAGLFPTEKPISLTPQYQLPKQTAPAPKPRAPKTPQGPSEAQRIERRIRDIERSASYRLGLVVTGTMFMQPGQRGGTADRRATLTRLERSNALGVGRWLTAPARGAVRLARRGQVTR